MGAGARRGTCQARQPRRPDLRAARSAGDRPDPAPVAYRTRRCCAAPARYRRDQLRPDVRTARPVARRPRRHPRRHDPS